MTDDLKISSANLFLIFNGDFIDRASYSVDCMILVNLLMKQNPEQVIYVAGTHERRGAWKDYSFRRELVSRGKYFSSTSEFLIAAGTYATVLESNTVKHVSR